MERFDVNAGFDAERLDVTPQQVLFELGLLRIVESDESEEPELEFAFAEGFFDERTEALLHDYADWVRINERASQQIADLRESGEPVDYSMRQLFKSSDLARGERHNALAQRIGRLFDIEDWPHEDKRKLVSAFTRQLVDPSILLNTLKPDERNMQQLVEGITGN